MPSSTPCEAAVPGGSQAVLAAALGSRKDFLVVGTEQEAEPMDYERLPESSEAFIYVAKSRLMARRLARS
jgi:hypothetical protein